MPTDIALTLYREPYMTAFAVLMVFGIGCWLMEPALNMALWLWDVVLHAAVTMDEGTDEDVTSDINSERSK